MSTPTEPPSTLNSQAIRLPGLPRPLWALGALCAAGWVAWLAIFSTMADSNRAALFPGTPTVVTGILIALTIVVAAWTVVERVKPLYGIWRDPEPTWAAEPTAALPFVAAPPAIGRVVIVPPRERVDQNGRPRRGRRGNRRGTGNIGSVLRGSNFEAEVRGFLSRGFGDGDGPAWDLPADGPAAR